MKLVSFRLRNNKSFSDSGELRFSDGFNVIVGQNNAGKWTGVDWSASRFGHAGEDRPEAPPCRMNRDGGHGPFGVTAFRLPARAKLPVPVSTARYRRPARVLKSVSVDTTRSPFVSQRWRRDFALHSLLSMYALTLDVDLRRKLSHSPQ